MEFLRLVILVMDEYLIHTQNVLASIHSISSKDFPCPPRNSILRQAVRHIIHTPLIYIITPKYLDVNCAAGERRISFRGMFLPVFSTLCGLLYLAESCKVVSWSCLEKSPSRKNTTLTSVRGTWPPLTSTGCQWESGPEVWVIPKFQEIRTSTLISRRMRFGGNRGAWCSPSSLRRSAALPPPRRNWPTAGH